MIKLKKLLEDIDQNNNGYPDNTEGSENNIVQQFLEFIKTKYPNYKIEKHNDTGVYSFVLSNITPWDRIIFDPANITSPYSVSFFNQATFNIKSTAEAMKSELNRMISNPSTAESNGSSLTDDELLDIIMSYSQDPDDAEMALQDYKETGEFSDPELESNITRDPRWK